MLINSGPLERAFTRFTELAEKQPDNLSWKFQIGRTAAAFGQHLGEGIAAPQACPAAPPARGNPARSAVYMRLGNIHEKRVTSPPRAPPTRKL